MMPILSIQQRSRELGRIRMGRVVSAPNGKTRPEKLDRFRLTSASKPLLEQVAALYGGTVEQWTPQGSTLEQYEVLLTAERIPVLVPPQPVTQWLELWSGGGCVRRCDGVTEQKSDSPCMCDPDEPDCKPTTRLNVVLRDVPGIGVWRLESKGWNAAGELPQVASFLAQAGGYVNAWLAMEERISKKDGQTHRFMVPALEVDVTPAQLLAGGGAVAAPVAVNGGGQAAIEAGRPDYLAEANAAAAPEGVRAVWERAKAAGHMTDDLHAALGEIGKALLERGRPDKAAADPDVLWSRIVAACPEDWTTTQLEEHFASLNDGTFPGSASAAQLTRYLEQLAGAPA